MVPFGLCVANTTGTNTLQTLTTKCLWDDFFKKIKTQLKLQITSHHNPTQRYLHHLEPTGLMEDNNETEANASATGVEKIEADPEKDQVIDETAESVSPPAAPASLTENELNRISKYSHSTAVGDLFIYLF